MKYWKKYYLAAKNTWDETFVYRLNFIIWRLRVILSFFVIYFLWVAILPANKLFLGYSQSIMLTYILGTAFLGNLVLSSRSAGVSDEIENGNLSNFLIRPINYLLYWFARDFGDKGMNVLFSIIEFGIIIFLLHPPLFLQTNLFTLLSTLLAVIFSIFLFFFFNFLIGLLAFWMNQVWSVRFIFIILLQFFAGSLFPLDILPKPIFFIFQALPFSYLLYFPVKLYLGKLDSREITSGLLISFAWILILYFFIKYFWRKGLKAYTAEGK